MNVVDTQPEVYCLNEFETTLCIENSYVDFLIDSGSALDIITLKTFDTLNSKLNKHLNLRVTKTKILTYGQHIPTLTAKGIVTLLVESDTKIQPIDFHVIDTDNKNLLSGKTAMSLNLISMPKIVSSVTEHVPERLKTLIQKYENTLFSGKIGKITGTKVKLHIDDKVPPIAQRERRIPFALRDKVKSHIDFLESEGIIEDVTNKSTPWISQMVIVPKSDKDIRSLHRHA